MKKTTFFLLTFFYTSYSQDNTSDRWVDNSYNTQITVPYYGETVILKDWEYSWENIFKLSVNDSYYDFFKIKNATKLDNRFIPWIMGNNQTELTLPSLIISGVTDETNDIGSEPMVVFDARKYIIPSSQYNGSSITNRSLFDWRSYSTTFMRMNALGYLGIGTIDPLSQLHTTGSVRFTGLQEVAGTSLVMTDNNGIITKNTIPAGATTGFITSSVSTNNLPRFNASKVMINSQLFDDGTNIGIGGLPVAGTKVTVYGTVNTLSDEREKTNIHHIENPIDMLSQINGYSYEWKSGGGKQIGLMAQEVEKVIPETVTQNENGTKFLNYNGIIPVLTEAIKLQQKEIELLKQEIILLKKRKRN